MISAADPILFGRRHGDQRCRKPFTAPKVRWIGGHSSIVLIPISNETYEAIERAPSQYLPLNTYELAKGDLRHYQQQYVDMYFLRLATLKPIVERVAQETWAEVEVHCTLIAKSNTSSEILSHLGSWRESPPCGPSPGCAAGRFVLGGRHSLHGYALETECPRRHIERCNALCCPQSLYCRAHDCQHWISAPPPREKYVSPSGLDQVMLEDQSGRLRLTGTFLQTTMLVTGCIVAVMGTENADGEFEVVDLKIPDLPRQPQRWERTESAAILSNGSSKTTPVSKPSSTTPNKVVIVSGLSISGDDGSLLTLDLLSEFLLGESLTRNVQVSAGQVSHLIIAGNSIVEGTPLAPTQNESTTKAKKYGYDASAYNPTPTAHLDRFLATLLPSIPITLLPGATDPANVSLPQQPIHPAMFPHARAYSANPGTTEPGWFDSVTNPWEGEIEGWRFMGTGGQPIDDIFKYVEGDDRLDMMECLLRWRNGAPTAPDTLTCYPFQDHDPFILEECPHVYFAGGQPRFESTVIEGPEGQSVRLVSVPKFAETGEVVVLDMDTLEVEPLRFDVFGEG